MKLANGVEGLDKLYQEAKTSKERFLADWFLNLSFYQGDQWQSYTRGRLYQPLLDKGRIRITDNRITGIVRTELAKMTKTSPTFVATPRTADEQDVTAARLAETLFDYLWNHLALEERLRGALLWSRVCGAGFWKIYWDSTTGDGVEVLMDGNKPHEDQNGRPIKADQLEPEVLKMVKEQGVKSKTIHPGEVCVEVRSPFQIFPDPVADNLHDAEWLIEEVVLSRDAVQRRYDVDLEPDTDANPGMVESRSGYSYNASTYKGVKIRELWMRPNKDYPNGCRKVWAKGKILQEDSNPPDPLPYVMFSGIEVPGRFWPTSVVSMLRGPQTELNKLKSQIRENANRTGNPAILISRQANVEYHGVPGERVKYDDTVQNAVPSYLQPPSMPGYVIQEIDRIEQAMREISGQHEVSGAQVPAGVTAASAINLLQEQDDTRLGPSVKDMEASLSMAGKKVLRLVASYYTEERTIQVAGEEGFDVYNVRGSHLGNNTEIDVQSGSSMPQSLAAKQAAMHDYLLMLLQAQVPIAQRNIRKYLKETGVGALDALVEDLNVDESQVTRENRIMAATGQPLPVNPFDNDDAHVQGHEDFQKGQRFSQLPPQVQQTFQQHVDQHKQRQAQAQQQQMMSDPRMAAQQQQMQQQQQQAQLQQAQQQQQLQIQGAQGQGQLTAQAQQMAHQQESHDAQLAMRAHAMSLKDQAARARNRG